VLRRPTLVATAVVLAATLAACAGGSEPDRPEASRSVPTAGPTADPSATAPSSSPTPPTGPDLADAQFRVGPPEIVMGPSPYVDSLVNAIQVGDTVRGYVANNDTIVLEGSSVATLEPTDRLAITKGDDGAFDDCGAWLESVEQDPHDPELLRAWYHAESHCAYADNETTHKSIAYAESRDGGRTFTKVGYPDNQVVRSTTSPAAGFATGRGAPTVVRRGRFYVMYYLNVLPDLTTVTSVARAPVSSGGVPGTWRNYTEDGSWTADALGGPAAALDTVVAASSASVHTPSGEVMLARQNASSSGIVLQASSDGIHFDALPEPIVPYLKSQIRADWAVVDDYQVIGYTSVVAPDGSRNWTDTFYLFHMYVFPSEDLHDGRYLVRRKVTVRRAPADGPWSLIALSQYDAGGDRYATSGPEKSGVDLGGALGYLLATPDDERVALYECGSAGGDRSVGTGCGTAPLGRLVGYAFRSEQPGTVALVACEARSGDQFTAARACGGQGRVVATLGYVYPPRD